MQIDKTTLHDLSIFHHDEEQSVFQHLNFTKTNNGKERLHSILAHPKSSVKDIEHTQQTIREFIHLAKSLPATITNGTLMVIEKFYDTPVNSYPNSANVLESFTYKILNSSDYSLTKYSVQHFIIFLKGMKKFYELFEKSTSAQQQTWAAKIQSLLNKTVARTMMQKEDEKKLSVREIVLFGSFLWNHFRSQIGDLINIYSQIDAYTSLATACVTYNFNFPVFMESEAPQVFADDLFHLQLKEAVAYNVEINEHKNFLFLTGANMGGKSTFIKALGIAVYLAHVGMGVPAKKMELSLFDGILSNIQVVDNIIKGESFFFNEVQRIKHTVEKISNGKKWLVLIDELFKGTNQQDAVKCSITVIEGLRKMQNCLFVLSTHLYEIGEALKRYSNIQFKYFETSIVDDKLFFSYKMQDGISSDRIGYLILKREGVVDLLNKL
jgi:DNA mismatch repair ATPase MutS